jgi:hypothetical protein
MGRNVFRTDFEPLALPREHIGIFYAGEWEFYRVEYVDSILPFRVDFGAISAGNQTNKLELKNKDYIGEPEENTLLELLVNPIDDVAIEVYNPGAVPLHYVSDVVQATKIQKKVAEHSRSDRFTGTGTQGPIWKVSTNRKAKVKRLTIANESTADAWVYLCKSDGTRLSASHKVLAGQTIVLDEHDLDFEFEDDIYVNTDQQPISVDIKVVEKVLEDYRNLTVIYGMKNRMPSVIVHNPTQYDLAKSIVEFSGYKYYLKPVEREPEKWTFVPLGGFAGVAQRA